MTNTSPPQDIINLARTASLPRRGTANRSSAAYARLSDLGRALADDPAAFRGVNLLAVYPPEAVLPDREPEPYMTWSIRVLTGLRDVLVFAPIAFTWLELRSALSRYHNVGAPFIAGWEQGFPDRKGHPTVMTLGSTALLIACFVLAIVLFTLLLHIAEGWLAHICLMDSERRDLASTLAQASAWVNRLPPSIPHPARPLNLEQIGNDFGASTRQLESSIQHLSDDIRQSFGGGTDSMFSKSLNEWTAAVATLVAIGETLAVPAKALQDFLDAQEAITAGQDRQAETIKRLVAQIQDASKASAEAAHLGRGVFTDVTETTRTLGQALAHFEHRVETLEDVLSQLRYFFRAQAAPGRDERMYADDDNPPAA